MDINVDYYLKNLPERALPQALLELASTRLSLFLERHRDLDDQAFLRAMEDSDFLLQLLRVWSCSNFVFEACITAPEVIAELITSGDLCRSYDKSTYRERLDHLLTEVGDEKTLQQILRRFRRREMIRLVWRDFTRSAELLETTGDVTRMAEAAINGAIGCLYPMVEEQLGTPVGKYSGERQQLVVLGMGKMGAWELNLSSDIDLIFAYPEDGRTQGAKREVTNQEFFIRLAQKLIQTLDSTTADGFVFRVDMRLRPYGESGAMVLNFDAMEEYYHSQGREWERYALIKARVIAGQREDSDKLNDILRPFTYRKYIDFSAIQSLRDMKSLINREVARLGSRDDVKKGAGGIREVEFIVQAFQLIRGGKDRRFQNPSLKYILSLLDEEQLLPSGEAKELWSAYEFLRNTEHALQGMADKQTQLLPQNSEGQLIVAYLMGFQDWDSFYLALEGHRDKVKTIFAGIAAETSEEPESSPHLKVAKSLWQGAEDAEGLAAEMEALGIAGADNAANLLVHLRRSRTVKGLTTTVRSRLDNFIPLLIDQCMQLESGASALERVLPLVEAILRRSAYLVLLIENPDALRQLVYLCSQSLWVSEQIALYPALLDELLDPRTLFTPADKKSIADELQQEMLRIPGDDLDAQMEALRHFRRAQSLRIAACEVTGALPLMQVSDNLTWLAEVILEQVLVMARAWIVARYGNPGRGDTDAAEPSLLIVGYGKLGGLELGHGSDLDVVFLHNGDPGKYSDGERSIDNNSYFIRLCQRIIHILSTKTAGGDLYEVDTRLRPNGNSGLLVTSLSAFEKYQMENAWTWEHQALVRARAVAGDTALDKFFEEIRNRVLCRERNADELKVEVKAMRDKMRTHLGTQGGAESEKSEFKIKQDAGGIVDIEFIVQYLTLGYAHQFPQLIKYTDNMRILDMIRDCRMLSAGEVDDLQQAYVFMRSLGHRLNLQGRPGTIDDLDPHWQEAGELRKKVVAVWQKIFATSTNDNS